MKKLILYIALLLPVLAWGQSVQWNMTPASGPTKNNTYPLWNAGSFPQYIILPNGQTAVPNRQFGIEGQVYIQWSDTTFRVFHGSQFIPLGGNGGSSSALYFTPYFTGTGTNVNPLTLAISPMTQDWIFNTNTHKFGLVGLGHTAAANDSALLVGTDGTVKKGVVTGANIYNSDGTLTAPRYVASGGNKLRFDSAYFNVPLAYTTPSGTIHLIGTSITAGFGATSSFYDYASVLGRLTGLTIDNVGRPGTTLGNPIVASSLVTTLSYIPSKGSGTQYLVFEYPPNDIFKGTSYTASTFNTDYHTVYANAISKSWLNSDIVLLVGGYLGPQELPSGFTIQQFKLRQDSFNNVIRALAIEKGCKVVDLAKIMNNNGGGANYPDGVHPNNIGHNIIAKSIYSVISTVLQKGQTIAANGLTEVKNFKLQGLSYTADSLADIMGIDTNGNAKRLRVLPLNISTAGALYLNGKTIQTNGVIPDSTTFPNGVYNAHDEIWNYKSRIISNQSGIADPSYWTMIEPADAGMNINLRTGPITGIINFFTNSTNQILSLNRDTSASFYGNISLVGHNKTISVNDVFGGFSTGGVSLLGPGSRTKIYNTALGGIFTIAMADGVGLRDINVFNVNQFGRVKLQENATDDDIPVARLAINSTHEGFLMPRVTETARDSMGYVAIVGPAVSGSGYTTATVNFSGGGGTGAAATAVITSGQIHSYVVTNKGFNYTSNPTVTITGDGTGATATATFSLAATPGLQVYNLSTNKINYWNVTKWIGLDSTSTGGTGITSISIASANGFTGSSSGGTTPALTLSLQNATTTLDGQLTHTDWNTFNNKQSTITLTTTGASGAATFSGGTLNIPQYANTTYSAGTGLTLTGTTFSVNTSQNISTLSNFTSNGLVKTSGGTGALSIASAGTDYQGPITLTTTGTGAATFVSNTLNIPTPTLPTGATPTALVGLTAVAGSATSFIRSDGTPAIDQSIAPTWTGVHIFQKNALGATTFSSLVMQNSTAAASGAQQYSNAIEYDAAGWNTSGTPASNSVVLRNYVTTVQGSTVQGLYNWGWNIAGGGETIRATLSSAAAFALLGSSANVSLTQSGNVTTNKDAFFTQNNTLSTSGVPVQISGSVHWQNHLYNLTATAADNFGDAIAYLGGTSGTTPNPIWTLGVGVSTSGTNAPGTRFTVDATGLATHYGAVVPDADNTRNIGSTVLTWANAYIKTVNANGTLTMRGDAGLGFFSNSGTQYVKEFGSTGHWVFQNAGTFTDNNYFLDVTSAGTAGYLRAGNIGVNTNSIFTFSGTAGTANQSPVVNSGGTAMTWATLATARPAPTITSASTLSFAIGTDYVFTGTTATYTAPTVASFTAGDGSRSTFYNRGSGSITFNSNAGGNDFYKNGGVSTFTLAAGAYCTLYSDGTFILYR